MIQPFGCRKTVVIVDWLIDWKVADGHNEVEASATASAVGKSGEDRSPMQSTESLLPGDKVQGVPCEPPSVAVMKATTSDKHVVTDMATLTVDDMVLICHLFYLPYEHGPRAAAMLHSVAWLLEHLPPPLNNVVPTELHSPVGVLCTTLPTTIVMF